MSNLRFFLEQQKAARHGVVLKGIEMITPSSHLILEEYARLRQVTVELPERDTPFCMGAHSYIRSGSQLLYVREVGRYCSIGRNVVLGEAPRNHPLDWVSSSLSVSHQYQAQHDFVSIGHDVWIAHDAVIMAGVRIGHGAVIGRNAIVTKDVEPYQIVAGSPARPIRYRFSAEQREALLESQWWNLDYETLRGLPFGDVAAFLQVVGSVTAPAAFRRIEIRRRRVSLLTR